MSNGSLCPTLTCVGAVHSRVICNKGQEYHCLFEADFVESMLEKGGGGPRAVGTFVSHDGVEWHGTLRVEKEWETES